MDGLFDFSCRLTQKNATETQIGVADKIRIVSIDLAVVSVQLTFAVRPCHCSPHSHGHGFRSGKPYLMVQSIVEAQRTHIADCCRLDQNLALLLRKQATNNRWPKLMIWKQPTSQTLAPRLPVKAPNTEARASGTHNILIKQSLRKLLQIPI